MNKNKENEKNQKIKCDVSSCDYNNCDDECCTLEEIKVSCKCGSDEATEKKETICDSFKCKSDCEEFEDDEDTEEE